MAANYWASNHAKYCINTKQQLAESRARYLAYITERDVKLIHQYFALEIRDMAKKLVLRQRVVATACLYWKRFYIKNSFSAYDPRLVAAASLYLASKVEESTIQARKFEQKLGTPTERYKYNTEQILDMEFTLLAQLNSHLIIFHPYHSLCTFAEDSHIDKECLEFAWGIVNDSYATDAMLLFPPHCIAVAAVFLAGTLTKHDMQSWLATLSIDVAQIWAVVDEILESYQARSAVPNLAECIPQLLRKIPRNV
eukprot:TRINITY_DN5804_c0_g1_i1.p1 TRINITY_DN5804_c0_g1~~TRINITY_DN5804_c0_g1_i1.p1  ORF type:complete len:253 (-),score=84.43 TRINITY_DN5804_c0_g1_i1:48-806(-)